MSKSKKGCHMKTQIPMSTYTFKWTVEHFSKLPVEKQITSPDFYPCSGNSKWYSTLEKSSSYLTWIMHSPSSQDICVEHNILIVDSSGKLWIKKKLKATYRQTSEYEYNNRTRSYTVISPRCVLIDSNDKISFTDMYELTKEVVTFCCSMTFEVRDINTQTCELESDDVNNTKNLEKLSNDLKTMYGVSLYTDVCLRIGSDSLRAHKFILCGRSPVFAKMFEHNLEEKETSVIEIADLEMNVLKDLIAFLYTASVPSENFDSVLSLYYAADKYEVKELVEVCGEILLSKINVDNACQVLALADRHSDHALKESVMTFVDIHLEAILATDGWSNLINEGTTLAAEVLQTRSARKSSKEEKTLVDEK